MGLGIVLRLANDVFFCRVLGKPRSLSAARILCKHDKFCGVDAEWDPQMRRRYFYCLRRFEGSHLIRDAVSTLCLISDRVLWNPKFTTAVEGWEPWARSRRGAARNTFVTNVSWQGTFGKNSACQIAATRSIDSKIVDRSAFVNHVAPIELFTITFWLIIVITYINWLRKSLWFHYLHLLVIKLAEN